MKYLICILLLTFSIGAKSQKVFCIQADCPQTIYLTDTLKLSAQLTTSDGFKSITWQQVSGPTKAILGTPTLVWSTGLQALSTVSATGLVPGTYTFSATGTSITGTSGSAADSVRVLLPPLRIDSVRVFYNNGTSVIQK